MAVLFKGLPSDSGLVCSSLWPGKQLSHIPLLGPIMLRGQH